MENNNKFLPIGTVVLLKGGKKELMIMSYCVFPTGEAYDKNGKTNVDGMMFDYGGCFYPEGMVKSDQLFVFNHDQIDRVCFKGYVTESYSEISDKLNTYVYTFSQDETDKEYYLNEFNVVE